MPKVIPITGALAAVLATAPGAFAQVTSGQDTAGSPWPTVDRGPTFDNANADTTYIRQAVRGNYTEVALGRLAGSRAENSEVKEFAERMISDHNSMNEKWTSLARDNEMKVVPDFGTAGQQAIERLEDLSGSEFDQAYMSEAIRQHEHALSTFERISSSARSSEVRELASDGVPTIRQHLALAQQVGSRVGVSSTAGRAGGVPTPVPAPSSDDRARRTTTDDRTNAANHDAREGDERASLNGADRAFVDNVLRDHLMHVRLATQAQRQGAMRLAIWPSGSRRSSPGGRSGGRTSPTAATRRCPPSCRPTIGRSSSDCRRRRTGRNSTAPTPISWPITWS